MPRLPIDCLRTGEFELWLNGEKIPYTIETKVERVVDPDGVVTKVRYQEIEVCLRS